MGIRQMDDKRKAEPKLELSQMIKSLRAELIAAQLEGQGEEVRFTVEDVELELDITAEESMEGGVAAKFYVLTTHYKANKKDAVAQKIKLKLKPQKELSDSATGEQQTYPVKIGGKVKKKGRYSTFG
jgi:hypothetical protein